jgi:hypothetical protein
VSILRAPKHLSKPRLPSRPKPRQRRPHERSVVIVIRPSEGQPDAYLRLTVDGVEPHYWLGALPSDYGRAFRLSKPGHEDPACTGYDVLLDTVGDSCTCPGHTYHNHCKHVDGLRALEAAGQLPAADGYKPGPDTQLPF